MDLSGAFEKLQDMLSTPDGQEQIQGMLSAFAGSSGSGSTENENSGSGKDLGMPEMPDTNKAELSNMITPDMIFKIQRIMALLNKSRPERGVEFLKCLKPLLRESRREKVDKAVKIMTLVRAMEILKKEGGI